MFHFSENTIMKMVHNCCPNSNVFVWRKECGNNFAYIKKPAMQAANKHFSESDFIK